MNRVIPKNTAAQSLLAGKLCSYETTNTEKQPIALIHQDARFFLITAGSGEMSVQNRQYPLTANTIVSIMPWQICDLSVDNDLVVIFIDGEATDRDLVLCRFSGAAVRV